MSMDSKFKKLSGLALAGALAFASNSAMAVPSLDVESEEGGLQVYKSKSGVNLFISGRLQLDETQFSSRKNLNSPIDFRSGARLRRAQVYFTGDLGMNFGFVLGLEFRQSPLAVNPEAGPFDNKGVEFRDAYITYVPMDTLRFGIGHMGNMYGLEHSCSSNDTYFLEYNQATAAFDPWMGMGVGMLAGINNMATIGLAITQPSANTTFNNHEFLPNADGKNDSVLYSGRITFAPVHDDCRTFHFGLHGYFQDIHKTEYSSAAGAYQTKTYNLWDRQGRGQLLTYVGVEALSRNSTLNTLYFGNNYADGSVADIQAKNRQSYGAELAFIYGPFSGQAEYHYFRVNQQNNREAYKAKGWYAQAEYVLFGGMRTYDFMTGSIGNIVPDNTCGAFALDLRYTNLDLRDITFGTSLYTDAAEVNKRDFGKGNSWTIGANYYFNDYVSIKANFVMSKVKYLNNVPDKKVNALGVRFQVTF